MAMRGIAGTLVDRLSWDNAQTGLDTDVDRGWAARLLAYLFGFGGILLLITLLLPGTAERDLEALAIVAGAAIAMALFLLVVFDSLPVWFLRAAPAVGTLLVALAIYYAGPGASAAYAMYMAWVVIAASLFLDTRLILAHGALAIGAYAFVLSRLDGSDGLDALRVTMTAGTVLVVALVMGGISGQLRQVLQKAAGSGADRPAHRVAQPAGA